MRLSDSWNKWSSGISPCACAAHWRHTTSVMIVEEARPPFARSWRSHQVHPRATDTSAFLANEGEIDSLLFLPPFRVGFSINRNLPRLIRRSFEARARAQTREIEGCLSLLSFFSFLFSLRYLSLFCFFLSLHLSFSPLSLSCSFLCSLFLSTLLSLSCTTSKCQRASTRQVHRKVSILIDTINFLWICLTLSPILPPSSAPLKVWAIDRLGCLFHWPFYGGSGKCAIRFQVSHGFFSPWILLCA